MYSRLHSLRPTLSGIRSSPVTLVAWVSLIVLGALALPCDPVHAQNSDTALSPAPAARGVKAGDKVEPVRLLNPLTLGPFASEISVSSPLNSQVIRFEQIFQLQAYGGTASRLTLVLREPATFSQVRLIAVGDGVLAVVPFIWNPANRELQARIVTPTKSLEYQLQLIFPDGRGQLSKWYSLSESCFQRVPVHELAELSPEKRQLIAELVAVDRDTMRLAHAISAIQQLLNTPPNEVK